MKNTRYKLMEPYSPSIKQQFYQAGDFIASASQAELTVRAVQAACDRLSESVIRARSELLFLKDNQVRLPEVASAVFAKNIAAYDAEVRIRREALQLSTRALADYNEYLLARLLAVKGRNAQSMNSAVASPEQAAVAARLKLVVELAQQRLVRMRSTLNRDSSR